MRQTIFSDAIQFIFRWPFSTRHEVSESPLETLQCFICKWTLIGGNYQVRDGVMCPLCSLLESIWGRPVNIICIHFASVSVHSNVLLYIEDLVSVVSYIPAGPYSFSASTFIVSYEPQEEEFHGDVSLKIECYQVSQALYIVNL